LNPVRTTERLRIEPLLRQHAALLYPVLQDDRIYTFIPQEPPGSVEELERRYERLEGRRSPDGLEAWLNWAVRFLSVPQYIGRLEATVRQDGTAVIAYEFCPEFWGKGYGTEACAWLVGELSANHGVSDVEAHVDTRNAASMRLLERLGFERVTHVANADSFKGSTSDEYIYRRRGLPGSAA
jgi:RimJ/RimL family protein N-acetyltransferase